jgi:hypothetical protein
MGRQNLGYSTDLRDQKRPHIITMLSSQEEWNVLQSLEEQYHCSFKEME